MIKINNPIDCCGCTACKSICPKNCITMKIDREGFRYPIVDYDNCINCGLCERVCPIKNKTEGQDLGIAYAVRNIDSKVLESSAAGGTFTAISKAIFRINGLVAGVKYTESMEVKHFLANSMKEAEPFRGSKYVQSDLGSIFEEIKYQLDKGKVVCFSGTPCQISGIKGFLCKDYDNLICIDVVCKGVATPIILKKYIELNEKKYGKQIVNLSFRTKDYGYHMSTTKIEFENGDYILSSGEFNAMMGLFIQNLCLRPSCHECRFKSRKRQSDITIFDCWSYKKLTGKLDDDKGYTSVWIHSEKGKELFERMKNDIVFSELNLDEIIEADGNMVEKSISPHPNRDKYFDTLISQGLVKAAKKYAKMTLISKFKDLIKRRLYIMGIYRYNR